MEAVECEHGVGPVCWAEAFANGGGELVGLFLEAFWGISEAREMATEGVAVVGRTEQPVVIVFDETGNAADLCGDHGKPPGCGLDQRHGQTFTEGRHDQGIGLREKWPNVLLKADKAHILGEAALFDDALQLLGLGSIADDRELGSWRGQSGECFEQHGESFLWAQSSDRDQRWRGVGSSCRERRCFLCVGDGCGEHVRDERDLCQFEALDEQAFLHRGRHRTDVVGLLHLLECEPFVSTNGECMGRVAVVRVKEGSVTKSCSSTVEECFEAVGVEDMKAPGAQVAAKCLVESEVEAALCDERVCWDAALVGFGQEYLCTFGGTTLLDHCQFECDMLVL